MKPNKAWLKSMNPLARFRNVAKRQGPDIPSIADVNKSELMAIVNLNSSMHVYSAYLR